MFYRLKQSTVFQGPSTCPDLRLSRDRTHLSSEVVWLAHCQMPTNLIMKKALSWLSFHLLTTTISLLSVVIPMDGKANTSVMSVLFWEAPDDGCLDGVDEPQ